MNKEDYSKYYIQGSDHYLIPKDVFKELFNEMINWKEEAYDVTHKIKYNERSRRMQKSLMEKINLLEQQCQKQKEVIDKAIKLIKYHERYIDGAECYQFVDIVSEILDPLQSILEQDETTNNAYLKEFEDWLKEVSE